MVRPSPAVHVTKLRTAVNAVRQLAGLGSSAYSDPTMTAGLTNVKVVHVTDLRTGLNAARSALSLPRGSHRCLVCLRPPAYIGATNTIEIGVRSGNASSGGPVAARVSAR